VECRDLLLLFAEFTPAGLAVGDVAADPDDPPDLAVGVRECRPGELVGKPPVSSTS